ncbi:glycoside hydrolase family 78 protein [Paenibacillus sp.]|uniref:glycoside hydrolase family 78 protein n=1 Tax=Paenibacillus sp. TaxID=58172 RepID=UPI002D3A8C68|nr:glycoside hydrolase family 78 protein [Paenibacillus sp.]HZG57368.1 glycoside hydrolase family 78 protein [Paenibacillus sp.]
MSVQVYDLRCEYRRQPLGIDVRRPRISWKLSADERGELQTAYRIQVAADDGFASPIWDSGKVESDESVHVELPAFILERRKRYYFRVQAWSRAGEPSPWSETSFWETGMLESSAWTANWIAAPKGSPDAEEPEQCPMLRRGFAVDGEVTSARIYATARGLYELELNGRRVGDACFAPGWTSYGSRIQYQTYDVTELLQSGENAIGALLGNGWYKGNIAWKGQRNIYGDRRALLLELHIAYADGRTERIATDAGWKAGHSPILMSEIYHGETYDARLERPGWSSPGFDDGDWEAVETLAYGYDELVAQENDPVRSIQELAPIDSFTTPAGEVVLDFGQNMVGRVRFTVQGEAGDEVMLEHAEVLDREGNFYTENLRAAKQTVRYILKGGEKETFEPRFTFQGFRYVRLTGFGPSPNAADFVGVVLHTDMDRTGRFACSDPLVNQLQHNIEWGQKGNFLDVPTDCPQRDERCGWTGDAQMFIRTAAYLTNIGPFFTKWLRDLRADQMPDGGVPFVIPDVLDPEVHSSSAWGDAAVICPWTIYLCYGDKRILEEQHDSMKAWVEYIRAQGDDEYLWNTGFHYGDWLGLDSKPDSYVGATDRDYIATAFYAYSTSLLRKTAEVLGKEEDAAAYGALYERVVAAFRNEFFTPTGRLSVPTQTAAVLALMFELVEGEARERTIRKLESLLEESKYHLTTGFVGTPYLNHVLSRIGRNDAAYKLLFQQDYPSWLYQVTKGATTIWEHWDGIKEDGSFWSKDMNSFNHYAYGAIGDWLYRVVAGIDTDESRPGYKHVRVRPQPGEGLTWAEASLETMYGEVRSAWRKGEDGSFTLEVTIPPNATADIVVPAPEGATVRESGERLDGASGVASAQPVDGGWLVAVGSGVYRFEVSQNQ